jgi:hypothetical protein
MPLLSSHEGVWEGRYRHLDLAGHVIDAHASVLVCRVTNDTDRPYVQTNISLRDDGRSWRMEYPARQSRLAGVGRGESTVAARDLRAGDRLNA